MIELIMKISERASQEYSIELYMKNMRLDIESYKKESLIELKKFKVNSRVLTSIGTPKRADE